MFDALREKLEAAFSRLRSRGKLSEADVDAALREIRKSLLEADVDFKVARSLVARIRERALQLDVIESISAAQHIATVVYEELVFLMGDPAPLAIASMPPTVILMVGLQGSGKTTTTVKLARRLQGSHNPLVVACDPADFPVIVRWLSCGHNRTVRTRKRVAHFRIAASKYNHCPTHLYYG